MNLVSSAATEPRAELVRAEFEMAAKFIEGLDPFDAAAITAAGDTPRHMVEQLLVLATNRFAVVAQGKILAMCGTFTPIRTRHLAEAGKHTPTAQFWALMSTHLDVAPVRTRQLLRHVTRELLGFYDELYGYIDARHERMLKLAEWLGGVLEEPQQRTLALTDVAAAAMPFRRFTIRS